MNYKKIDDKIFISIDKGELVNQKLLEVAEQENLTLSMRKRILMAIGK